MANIGVSELMFDLDFVDPCVLIRSVETVGDDGMVVYVEERHDILASIQSNNDMLMMTPDFARTSGAYEVITAFALNAATDTTKADTIIWHGRELVITSVGRFGNFPGLSGHYEGVAELKTISPSPGPP